MLATWADLAANPDGSLNPDMLPLIRGVYVGSAEQWYARLYLYNAAIDKLSAVLLAVSQRTLY